MNKRLSTNVKTKLLISVLTFLVFFSVIQINSYATIEDYLFDSTNLIEFDPKDGPIVLYNRNEGYRERTIREMEETLGVTYDASIYSRYDLREDVGNIRGIDIPVKNQGETSRCWIYSVNSAIESNLAKISGIVQRFDEEYTDIETMKLYNKTSETGGNLYIALGFYTSGEGLKNLNNDNIEYEVEDYVIFPSITKEKVNGVTKYYNGSSELTSEEVKDIRNQIKNHIINYGAVSAMTYSQGVEYYNKENNLEAYYCDDSSKNTDHQITIIGWDDNYSVTNFNASCRPSTPGAYIVLNSWGTEVFGDGIYYISYEDVNIENNIFGIKQTNAIDHDKIYQHDKLGISNAKVFSSLDEVYGANVFDRENSEKTEVLTEISISNLIEEDYEIYVNPKSSDLTISNLIKVATISDAEAGYHTIELDEPITLTGDKFAIAVKYSGSSEGPVLGVEEKLNVFWTDVSNNNSETFLSTDGNTWIDINQLEWGIGSNLTIKAFTNELEEVIERELVSISVKEMPQKTSYKVGETLDTTGLKLEATYSDETKEEITSGFTCTPTKLTTEGTQTITVSYEGKTTTFKVTVEKASEETQEVLTEESSYEIGGVISAFYIKNVQPNTSIKTFKTNINQKFDVEVYTEDGTKVTDENDIIKTSMFITLKENGKDIGQYMLIVMGDVTEDGKADFSDILSINKHRLNRTALDSNGELAADVTGDEKVNFNDILKINKFRLGRINEL